MAAPVVKGKPAKAAKTVKANRYEVKDGKAVKKGQTCPRCGDGVFLANHKDRLSCGKCSYTEFKK
jgi:small subunit ribosomal protein S27Ae